MYSPCLRPDVAPATLPMSNKPTPSAPPPSLVPPPADSGSGKYLLVMLVLGGAMAGLFAWRHSQSEPPPPAPSPSASAAIIAAHAAHDVPDDIPPPPPSLPDASPDTGARKAVVGNYGDNCGHSPCNGAITNDLSSALAFRAKTAHKCYDEALAQDPTLKGQVVLNVKVSSNGTVCGASVHSNDIANGSIANCIANKYRQSARLPSPVGGCVEVNVPMKLLPPH